MDKNPIDLDTFVLAEGSTRVRAFALDWEFRAGCNPDTHPMFLTTEEWADEFRAYCYVEETDDGDYLDRRFTGAVRV